MLNVTSLQIVKPSKGNDPAIATPVNQTSMKKLLSTLTLALAFSAITFAAGPPVNEVCPVCGKTARLIFRSDVKGQHIIFFSADCKDKFDKAPGKYKVTPKKE
jgi:hypothetical protein